MINIPRVGIGVLLFHHHKLLLGKRLNSHGENSWAPPGGHLEFGETFEKCGARELFEETGLKISNLQFISVTNDIFASANKHYISIFLSGSYPSEQSLQNLEPHKTLEWQWFDLLSLPENLFLPLKNLIQQLGMKKFSRLPLSYLHHHACN